MGLVKLEVGAELDIASSKDVDEMGNSLFDRMKDPEPRYFSIKTSGASVNNFFYQSFPDDSPPDGHMWDILGITTCGTDDHTVVANGTVALYFGNAANPSLMDLKVPGLAIPDYDDIGPRRLWVHQGEHVYVGVAGAANTPIQVYLHIAEYQVRDVMAKGLR